MRRTALSALMAALLLLCSCSVGKTDSKNALTQLRAQVENASEITALADVTADFGNKILRYTLSYREKEGTGEITVLAPELIAGVTAKTVSGTSSISYDSVILDTGTPGNTGLSPVEALPAVIESIRAGHMEASWSEDYNGVNTVVCDLTISEESVQSLWLQSGDTMPIRSEIRSDGQVVIICEFKEWNIS